MGLQYNITTTPTRLVFAYSDTGVYLTNTGFNTIYVGTDSAVTNLSQPLDIGGSLYFEPGIELWAAVIDTTNAGNLTITYGASDRWSNFAPPITYLGTTLTTTTGQTLLTQKFTLSNSAASQYKAYKIVVRLVASNFTPTISTDQLWRIGAVLNFENSPTTLDMFTTVFITATTYFAANRSLASVIVPVTNATSGTFQIGIPGNTRAAGDIAMDIYGLSTAPPHMVPWQDLGTLSGTGTWTQTGNTYRWNYVTGSPLTNSTDIPLPIVSAPYNICAWWTQSGVIKSYAILNNISYGGTNWTTQLKYPLGVITEGAAAAGSYYGNQEFTSQMNGANILTFQTDTGGAFGGGGNNPQITITTTNP